MKNKALLVGVVAAAGTVLAGCGTTRWSGHYKHSDANPQLHHDWSAKPGFPSTSSPDPSTPLFTQFPTTSEEHRLAAQRYRDKANQYRMEAAGHDAMRAAYGAKAQGMRIHCDQLIQQLNAAADKLDIFAQWHEQQARPAQK